MKEISSLLMKEFRLVWLLGLLLTGCSRPQAEGDGKAESGQANWRKIDAAFAQPPAEFRMIQFSDHHGDLLPMAKMAEAGVGGVELFMKSEGYFRSDEVWKIMAKNIAAAKEAGLRVWVADENGYPSGLAGGLVVEADPALEARCLLQAAKDGKGIGAVRLDLPKGAEKFVCAFLYPLVNEKPVLDQGKPVAVQPGCVETEGMEGAWRLCAFALEVMFEGTTAQLTAPDFKTTGHYPNLLQSAAMEKFVSLTHEEYARRFGPLAGKIDAFITNEPLLQSCWSTLPLGRQRPGKVAFLPWDADLPRRFQQEHGYDLLPLLPALYGGDDPASKLTRRHFFQTVGTMLAENFSGRIATWAEKNGTQSAGHPVLEEVMMYHVIGYGDFFRYVAEIHIPTCDVPMPDPGAYWNFWMPKFLSSVAQAKDRDTVACLLDPIIDRPVMELKPSPGPFRRIINMAVLCGVNQFQTYLRWADYEPAVYRGVCEYIGRLAAVLRGARSAATVAMYYPIETFQSEFLPSPDFTHTTETSYYPPVWRRMMDMMETQNTIARSLLLQGIDFTWLHGDWIQKAKVEKGCLIAANGRYRTIVMPEVELLPLAVARKLEEFEKGGGKVLWVKCLPQLGDTTEEHEKVKLMFAKKEILSPGLVAEAIGTALPPGFTLETGSDVLTARFTRDGRHITYLVNYQADTVTVPVTLASGKSRAFDVYNPMDGTIQHQELLGTVTIQGNASLMVVEPSR